MLRLIPVLIYFFPLAEIFSQEDGITLPRAYPALRYQSIWENSPFEREVVAASPVQFASAFGKTLVLEGLIDDADGPIAYVKDQREKGTYVVTEEASGGHSYRIVSVDFNRDPRASSVTLTNGKESAVIKYANNVMSKAVAQAPSPRVRPTTPQAPQGGAVIFGQESARAPEAVTPNPAAPQGRVTRRRLILPGTQPAQNQPETPPVGQPQ